MKEYIQKLKQLDYKHYSAKPLGFVKKLLLNISLAVIIIGICFVIISPLIGIVAESFMDIRDVYNPLIYIIPENFTLKNYQYALKYLDYKNSLGYSLFFSIMIMLIQVFVCSMVGYGFARFRFPGKNILFGFVIITIVVPIQTLMVPMYMQFRYFDGFGLFKLLGIDSLNLINSAAPVVMMTVFGMGLKSGLYIYIFRQFFRGLPKEIEEAAFIDGAGKIYTYFRVMLPNAVSSLITVMLFAFVWQYNDTYYASVFMNRSNLLALKLTTVGPTFSNAENILDPNYLSLVVNSGVILNILPLLIIYLVMQRYFMEGIERSGIVG